MENIGDTILNKFLGDCFADKDNLTLKREFGIVGEKEVKITIVRHGKVNMKWPKKCSSDEFDMACTQYDRSGLEDIDSIPFEKHVGRIYVSKLSRSVDTAKSLFPNNEYYEMPEIGEVPLKSFRNTKKRLPLWIWNVCGRVQWYIGSERQSEKRKDTIERANKVIDLCESVNGDCVLVTHGFFMKTMTRALKNRGYLLTGNNQLEIKNLQVIRAEK